MANMPFQPHDKLKQFGIRELAVDSDKVKMINGSVGASWEEVTIPNTPIAVLIINTHLTQYLRFSLDGGTTYFTIFSKGALKLGAEITSFYLYGEGASTTYDVLYFELES